MGNTKISQLKKTFFREDVTPYLYHMIKFGEESKPLEVLCSILEQETLIGSGNSGFVCGDKKVVCFQALPIREQIRNYLYSHFGEDNYPWHKFSLFGVGFSKEYLYHKGCRPVIYEDKNKAKQMLKKDDYWRIVNLTYGGKIVDWTHEREWRLPVGEEGFKFDLNQAVIIVPNKGHFNSINERFGGEFEDRVKRVITVLDTIY